MSTPPTLHTLPLLHLTGLSSIVDIISCRRLGLCGHVARPDSGVPARDALEGAYARHTEIRLPSGCRRPPRHPRQTWLHQRPSAKNGTLGRIHIDMSTGYGLFIRVKLLQVECSRSLVQAQTLVIQTPLKNW